ncbi:hypothetical protein ABT095_03145 [Kitasatospora sp. NPDC002227]|uniref:hypothetical protein n=1 Tax=Kitasatospora sp. NPDC002227 TaxID=3154773 RepID=UPI0033238C5C
MARLIVIVPLLLLALAKLVTWWFKRRTAALEARKAAFDQAVADRRAEFDPAEHGLAPTAELAVKPLAGPEHTEALAAARAGDWRPAAALIASAGTDWELRYLLSGPYRELAGEEDGWLRAWREAEPANADAAALHADSLVVLAWELRSSKAAAQVTREQFRNFHRVLQEAEAVSEEAVRLADPADPTPWLSRLPIGMGLNWSNETFEENFAEITKRVPLHWAAHFRALQYWCEKWHGSHELMHRFADTATAAAPAGSLLTVLKLEAWYEQLVRQKALDEAWAAPKVQAALDAALADLAAADPAHPKLDHARGWLAYMLGKAGRPAEALEQFQALGGVVPLPFSNFHDPVVAFDRYRTLAVLKLRIAAQ